VADTKEYPIIVPTKIALTKGRSKRQLTVAFNRVLKRNKLVPLHMLINEVLPLLDPPKQADILMKLLDYQYPKISSQKKESRIQTNVQVNVPAQKQQSEAAPAPQISLQDLLAIASGKT